MTRMESKSKKTEMKKKKGKRIVTPLSRYRTSSGVGGAGANRGGQRAVGTRVGTGGIAADAVDAKPGGALHARIAGEAAGLLGHAVAAVTPGGHRVALRVDRASRVARATRSARVLAAGVEGVGVGRVVDAGGRGAGADAAGSAALALGISAKGVECARALGARLGAVLAGSVAPRVAANTGAWLNVTIF